MKNKITETKISELIPDNINANKHTEYGMHLLEKSISELGLARSIVVDKNNRIIGGNGVTETAGNLGMDDCIVVETDGKKLVVVKRMDVDIDSKLGRSLALADNATSQANLEFDEENLKSISSDFNIDLGDWGLQPDFSDEPDTPIQEKEIKPFERTHVLLSFSPEIMMDIQDLLQKIKDTEGIEYEQASN